MNPQEKFIKPNVLIFTNNLYAVSCQKKWVRSFNPLQKAFDLRRRNVRITPFVVSTPTSSFLEGYLLQPTQENRINISCLPL
jgi:hypothetical protein